MDIVQIELRKRGVIPKETNVVNQIGTQADKDRARDAALRRDKRGGFRVSFLLSHNVTFAYLSIVQMVSMKNLWI